MSRQRLIEALLRLLARLPLPAVHALGAGAGWLLWRFPNDQRRVARINLALAWPELSADERDRLLRHTLMEAGKTLLELGPLWLWPGQRVLDHVRRVEGQEAWQRAVDQGRGAIAITPHLGAWEVSGLYVSAHWPITTLYRPSRQGLDQIIRSGRERLGANMAATDTRGVKALFQALRKGEVLGILPDQDPGRGNGIFAPFFGVAANTMGLLSKLAIKSGVPVFLLMAERLPRGRGYVLRFIPLPEQVNREPLEASVAALNRAVEAAVRQLPAQYLWTYKRYKTRPPGEERIY